MSSNPRLSPVMDSADELAGDSPAGSPSSYIQARKAKIEAREKEEEEAQNHQQPLLNNNETPSNKNDNSTTKAYGSNNNNTNESNLADATSPPGHLQPNHTTQHQLHHLAYDDHGTILNAQGTPLHPHLKKVVTTATDVFESLNYDEVENIPLQEERIKRGGDLEPATWKVWIILAICGFVTGLVAFGIDVGQSALAKAKFRAVEHFMMRDNVSSSSLATTTTTFAPTTTTTNGSTNSSYFYDGMLYNDDNGVSTTVNGQLSNFDSGNVAAAIFSFIFINLGYVLIAAGVVVFGEPVAKGSGIPEVKCYLNGVRIWRVVRLKTMLVKASGILFAVASGLPVGKEGPMIHSGSAIASGISTGKSSLLKWDTGFFKEFRSDAYKRAFITAGAAAGVGAAFGAPIGGIIFAIEEVGSFWNIELTVMVFVCAAIAPWTLQLLMHPDGLESGKVSGLIDFGLISGSYSYKDIPFLIVLGILCGGLGAIFIHINVLITKWRKVAINTKWKKLAEVCVISLTVSTILIFLVLFGYDCVKIEGANENTQASMKQYGCAADEFNDMATYFFVELEKSINLLIHEPRAIHLGTLAKQFVPMFFLTIVTYGINVPSGLFLPSLALGANFGHMFAQLMNLMIPGLDLNCAHFAFYGGTGLLAGNLRMTISVVAIVMEASGNATLFYPLAIIVMCAKLFGDLFNHGIFDEHIDLAKIPLLMTKNPQPEMATMDASEIMNKIPVRLPSNCSVRVLIHVLKHYSFHNTYVVADEETGRFRGLLLRRTALILVDKEAWKNVLTHDDFSKTEKERKYVSVKKYGVLERPQEEDMDEEIDLLRYADLWPHLFHVSTPVPRVYRTFRELGLRHIIIVDDENRPVGLIGRRQLCFLEVSDKKRRKNAQGQDETDNDDDSHDDDDEGSDNDNNNNDKNGNKNINGDSSETSLKEKEVTNTSISKRLKKRTSSISGYHTAKNTDYQRYEHGGKNISGREKKNNKNRSNDYDDDDYDEGFVPTGALPVEEVYVPASSTSNDHNNDEEHQTGGSGMNRRSRNNSTAAVNVNNNNNTTRRSARNSTYEAPGSVMLPLNDEDVRRSRMEKAPWMDASVPEH